MATNESSTQNYALILMAVGVMGYIAVDTGIIQWSKSAFNLSRNSTQGKASPEESLLRYSEKINQELVQVEKDLNVERGRLSGLQSQVSSYERNIRRQRSNLAELEKEIKTLSELRQTLEGAQASVGQKSGKKIPQRSLAATAKTFSAAPPAWDKPPSSISEIESKLKEMTKAQTSIESVSFNAAEYFRLKTSIRYDEVSGIYLTARGIKQTRTLVEGAIGLGYGSMTIAHNSSDTRSLQRVRVLKQFLQESYGNEMDVESLPVEANMQMTDGLELWIGKGG